MRHCAQLVGISVSLLPTRQCHRLQSDPSAFSVLDSRSLPVRNPLHLTENPGNLYSIIPKTGVVRLTSHSSRRDGHHPFYKPKLSRELSSVLCDTMAGRSLHLFFVTLGLLCLWFPHAQGQTCAPGQLRNGSFSVALPYLVAQNMGYFAAEGISPCLSTVSVLDGSRPQFLGRSQSFCFLIVLVRGFA